MSKKRRKIQTNRRRNAARRARMAKQRRQRRGPAPAGRRGPLQTITFTRDGFVTVNEVPEADAEAHLAYIEAHRLLPPGFPVSDEDQRTRMAMALFTLEDPMASADAVLRAIMILGHTPNQEALTALRRYAAQGGVHADLAKPAAEECAMWLDNGKLPPPPQAPRPSAMLN